jgi:hypothetical protein
MQPVLLHTRVGANVMGNPTMLATTCVNGHPYTPANTYMRPDGAGRQCRTCKRGTPPHFDIHTARHYTHQDSVALRLLYIAYGYIPATTTKVSIE